MTPENIKPFTKEVKTTIRAKLFFTTVVTIAYLFALSLIVTAGDAEVMLEDFELNSYGERSGVVWQLSGKRGLRGSKDLIARDFELVIRKESSNTNQPVSVISGDKLRLEGGEEEYRAYTPGLSNIEIGNQLEGTARNLVHDLPRGQTSGEELEVTQIRSQGELRLVASGFSYHYDSGKIEIKNGFELDKVNSTGKEVKVRGDELVWDLGKRMEMAGNVFASFSSGLDLKAEKMTWDPKQGLWQSKDSDESE